MASSARFPLLLALLAFAAPLAQAAQVSLEIRVGPPPIPIYDQPPVPGDGYVWTPGYWAWDQGDYYWVPGTWVQAPAVGLLWTPGYWGWRNGFWTFNTGYWGNQVGFYGGVNYGHGYGGSGFQGGRWEGGHFAYNRSVTNVEAGRVHNVYSRPVAANPVRTAFNGGPGGLRAAPTRLERRAGAEHHQPPTPDQVRHHESASRNKDLRSAVNKGRPPVAATVRPGDFTPGSSLPSREPPPRQAGPRRAEPPHTERPNLPRPDGQPRPQPPPRVNPPGPRPNLQPAPHPNPQPAPHANPQPAPHANPQPAPHPAPAKEREEHPKG